MNDYIMNRESLKRHCEAMCKKFKDVPTSGAYGEHRLVLDLLEQTEWIPVSERLPEDCRDVLVWFEYYRYGSYNRMYSTFGIGTYSAQYDSWMVNHESGWKDLRVIAWMPLPPEPYKGESNGTDTSNN